MSGPEFQLDVIVAYNLMGSDFNLKISAPAIKHGVQCYWKDALPTSQKTKHSSEINQTQNLLGFK